MRKDETLNLWRNLIYYWESLKRSWDYARFGFNNYDYDWEHLIAHIHFKMARLEKIIHESDWLDKDEPQNKRTLKSIRLSRTLLEKFLDDDYTLNQNREKEGYALFCKQVESGAFFSGTYKEDPAIVRYLNAVNQDEKKRHSFLEKGLAIMVKYHKYWWD